MYITITKEDVEEMTGLVSTTDELDEIARKLDSDYRHQLFSSSMEIIAGEVIGEDVSQARGILRGLGIEDFYEVLFVSTYADIVTVIADELGSLPDDRREAVCEAVDWETLVIEAVRTVRLSNLYDEIAHAVRPILYEAENALKD